MAWTVGLEPPFLPLLLAATVLGVLAVLVFLAKPGARLNRSFAALLLCKALFFGLLALEQDAGAFLGRLRVYPILALPFVTTYVAFQLLVCYGVRSARKVPTWVLGVGLGVAGLAVEVAYFLDHSLFWEPSDGGRAGPFDLFFPAGFVTTALVALVLAFALRANRLGLARRSLWQATAGFAIMPLYYAGFYLSTNTVGLMRAGSTDWLAATPLPVTLLLVLCVLGSGACVVVLLRQPPTRRAEGWRLASLLGLVLGSSLVGGVLLPWRGTIVPHFVLYGLWSLASAILVAAPILRDRILDVEYRVERTFSRGFLATFVAGTGFVVMQVATNWLTDTVGMTVGGGVAILMLFALHPLQRLCDSMAAKVVPGGEPLARMGPAERETLYAEQATLAWSDGSMTVKERRLLDQLRGRLGLAPDVAARLEKGVLG